MLFSFVLYFFGQLKWTVLIYCVFYVRSEITRPNHTVCKTFLFQFTKKWNFVWNCSSNIECNLLFADSWGRESGLYQLCWTVVATGVIVYHFNLCVISFWEYWCSMSVKKKKTKFWFTYRTHHPMWINKENKTAQEEVRHFLKFIFKIRSQIFIVFKKKKNIQKWSKSIFGKHSNKNKNKTKV